MFRKSLIFIFSLFSVIFLCGCNGAADTRSEFMFDTVAQITVYSAKDKKTADQTLEFCSDFENIFSATRTNSEVYRLNNSSGFVSASDHLLSVINLSVKYAELSNGEFDFTVRPITELWNFKRGIIPSDADILNAVKNIDYKRVELNGNSVNLNGTTVDFGGIAKGYITDKTVEFLKQNNVENAIVNFGGNIAVIGKSYDIGIKTPFKNTVCAAIRVQNKAVSTSGTYERYIESNGVIYHHILSAKTGYPVQNDLNSATVITEHSVDADALSTICILLGREKATDLIEGLSGVEAIFIDKSGLFFHTSGIEKLNSTTYICE